MHIQVVQDLICPWCRIGKRNLDTAIAQYRERHDDEVTVEWVPFLLDRVEPGAKEPFRERLAARKGLTDGQIEGMFTRVSEAGEACGLGFNWDKVEVAVDTIPGHQMLALAPAELQSALLDAIHTAYFEDGKDIGEPEVLTEIGAAVGIPEDALARMREAWASEAARAEALAVVEQVQQAGVSGVPFFIFDGELATSGAQPPEVLLEAMTQARATPAGARAE